MNFPCVEVRLVTDSGMVTVLSLSWFIYILSNC